MTTAPSIGDVLTAEHLGCGRRAAWAEHLAGEFDKCYMRDLRQCLVREERSHRILPQPHRIFEALDETTPEEAKVVILGQDPYPTYGQAHGLAFSVEQGDRPGPLAKVFMAIGRDLRKYPGGCSNRRPGTGGGRSCLTPWARQGVLLLNTALTVREGCAGAHIGWGWQHFTDRVIDAIASASQPVVFMLWGKEAQAKRDRIGGQHLVLCDRHPRTGLEKDSQPFSGANDYLQHHGREPINWLDVCSRPPANAGAHLAPLTAADADDEAQWDRQFARAPRFLEQLADEAARERELGQTEELDPTRW